MMNPKPPEGLTDKVKTEVDTRMQQTSSAAYLGFNPLIPLRAEALTPIPRYSLALTHPTTVEQVHSLETVSSWSYLVELTPQGGGDSLFIFAEAVKTPEGEYEYSSITNLPKEINGTQVPGIFTNDAHALAILEAPYYYIEAFWKRTRLPATDVLVFVRNTFGRFPPWTPDSRNTVPLSDLVYYLNTQLDRPF
jgi:hypothetical protein